MITAIQVQRRLGALIRTALESGRVPRTPELAAALTELLPTPGQPAFVPDIPRGGDEIDSARYTATWESIYSDLDDLYVCLYEQYCRLLTVDAQLDAAASALNTAANALATRLQMLARDPLAVAWFQLYFTDAATIASSAADIDHLAGTITLPQSVNIRLADLSGATISSMPLSGTEVPLAFSPLSRILMPDAPPWLTQVRDTGRGCSYRIQVEFAAVTASSIKVITTHEQDISLFIKQGENWVPWTETEATFTGLRIELLRGTGQPDGGDFRYTFGIRHITIGAVRFQTSASVTFTDLALPASPWTHLHLVETADIPQGTAIAYTATLLKNGVPVEDPTGVVLENIPITSGLTQPVGYFTTVDELPSVSIANTTRKMKTTTVAASKRSLSFPGCGVYVGEGYWKVDSYPYDWSIRPRYQPGPDDWSELPRGVFPEEVVEEYRAIHRNTLDPEFANRFDELPLPASPSGLTLRWTTQVYAPYQVALTSPPVSIATDPDSDWYDRLAGTLQAITRIGATDGGLQLTPYLNGVPIAPDEDGLHWPLHAGWNTIQWYGYLPLTAGVPEDLISTGCSLTPATFHGTTFVATDYDPTADHGRITEVRASAAPLLACSLFDVQYNTPLLCTTRVGVEESGDDSILYLPYLSTVWMVRYGSPTPPDPLPDTLRITATLSTAVPTATPELHALEAYLV